MAHFDPLIHQPVRLKIMAALVAHPPEFQLSFNALKELVQTTEGNLGAHLRKLEDGGYVKVIKTFVGRRPRTYLQATEQGRKSFAEHTQALKEFLAEVEQGTPGQDTQT